MSTRWAGMVTLTDEELADTLERSAATLAEEIRSHGDLDISAKSSPGDLVTHADRAAEAQMQGQVRDARPMDAIVGEEGAAAEGRGSANRTWYLDPVDGTTNFAHGLPAWCSAAALVVDDVAVVGAVCIPERDELWVGGARSETRCNGVPVPAVAAVGLSAGLLATYIHPSTLTDPALREPFLRLCTAAASVRVSGSGSCDLAAVAAGRIALWVQPDCHPWDWFPGAALVAGAGGTVRIVDVDGHRWHLAGSSDAVDDAVAVLTDQRVPRETPRQSP